MVAMRELDPLYGIAPDFKHRIDALDNPEDVFERAAEAVMGRVNWCERINPGDMTTYVLFLVFEGRNCWFGSSLGPAYPWGEIPLEQSYVSEKWTDHRSEHSAAVFTWFLNNVWRYMEVE